MNAPLPVMPVRVRKPRAAVDARTIRLNARPGRTMTQSAFANAIGVPVKTLRNWEQNRRHPTGPARVLLQMIEKDPGIVGKLLNAPAA